jgi:hypothetical protein
VLRFRDHAFSVYFTHQPYLDMVASKFGADTVAHIRDMTSHRIQRLLLTADSSQQTAAGLNRER